MSGSERETETPDVVIGQDLGHAAVRPDPDSESDPEPDPQGMRGQLDDSMNGLEPDDDEDAAARGIPQNTGEST